MAGGTRTDTINWLAGTLLTPDNVPGIQTTFPFTPEGITLGHLPAIVVSMEPGESNSYNIEAQQLLRDDYTIGIHVLVSGINESNRSLVEASASKWADLIAPLLAANLNLGGYATVIGDGENLFADSLGVYQWASQEFRDVRFLVRVSSLRLVSTGITGVPTMNS